MLSELGISSLTVLLGQKLGGYSDQQELLYEWTVSMLTERTSLDQAIYKPLYVKNSYAALSTHENNLGALCPVSNSSVFV